MADFITIGKPLSITTTKAMDSRFGPFSSIAEAYSAVGPNGTDTIYAGLQFCVVANGNITFYKWTKTNNVTVNDVEKIVPDLKTINGKLIVGNGNLVINDIIVIAGIKTSGTELSGTGAEGSSSNIYYYSEKGVLGLSNNGGTSYYTRWDNEDEFGTYMIWDPTYSSGIYTGNLKGVVPLNNRLYLDSSTGDIKFASDKELQDIDSNFVPTSAQQSALDSGITSVKVAALDALIGFNLTSTEIEKIRALLNMGISHNATTDILTINNKQYDLSAGGTSVVVTYGTPVITISYPTISNNGGTYYPTITVSQDVYKDNVLDSPIEYNSVNDLIQAIGQNNVVFSYYDNSVDRFASFDSEDGRLEADPNSTENTKTSRIKISITMNGVSGDADCTVTQSASIVQNKIYITSLRYDTAGLVDGEGYTTLLPTLVASDGNEYSYNTYTELGASNIETIAFSCSTNYGATVNSTTGAVRYKLSDMISNMSSGTYIKNITVTLTQENASHNKSTSVNLFDYNTSEMTQLLAISGVRGGSNPGYIYKGQSNGLSSISLSLNAGDVIAFKHTFTEGVYVSIFETRLKLVTESGGVAVIANSTSWSTSARTTYNTFVANANGKETHVWIEKNDTEIIYKVLGNVTYSDGTTRVTIMIDNILNQSSGDIYYTKLN